MDNKKSYFVYYETFETIVQRFPTEQTRNDFRQKIINYGLFGIMPDLDEKEYIVWGIIEEIINAQKARRETNRANRAKRAAKAKAERKSSGHAEEKTSDASETATKPETDAPTEKPKEPRFHKPTIDDVKSYISETGSNVDPDKFYSYYESNGWKVGRTPMKNWQAAVRNWSSRDARPASVPTYGSGIDPSTGLPFGRPSLL